MFKWTIAKLGSGSSPQGPCRLNQTQAPFPTWSSSAWRGPAVIRGKTAAYHLGESHPTTRRTPVAGKETVDRTFAGGPSRLLGQPGQGLFLVLGSPQGCRSGEVLPALRDGGAPVGLGAKLDLPQLRPARIRAAAGWEAPRPMAEAGADRGAMRGSARLTYHFHFVLRRYDCRTGIRCSRQPLEARFRGETAGQQERCDLGYEAGVDPVRRV